MPDECHRVTAIITRLEAAIAKPPTAPLLQHPPALLRVPRRKPGNHPEHRPAGAAARNDQDGGSDHK